MADANIITLEELKSSYIYKKSTGRLYSKKNPANIKLLTSRDQKGYLVVVHNKKHYKQHRLAWLYENGEWPKHHIDHINGIKDDNRIVNLRDIPHRENQKNKPTVRKVDGKRVGFSCFKQPTKKPLWTIKIYSNGTTKKFANLSTYQNAVDIYSAYVKDV